MQITGPYSFAERLRRVGAEFDLEVETAAQHAQRETRSLRGEVERLQRQLEGERQQSAARLGLCAELKRQVEEAQESHHHEIQVREYWQREAATLEQRSGLLEAKLEGMALTEQEAEEQRQAAAAAAAAASASTVGSKSHKDEAQLLELLQEEDSTDDSRLLGLASDDLHGMLVAAARRREGAAELIRRVVQLWVGKLLNKDGGAALRAAIGGASEEATATLLSIGGPRAAVAAVGGGVDAEEEAAAGAVASCSAASPEQAGQPCVLALCVQRGDTEMLSRLLEQLRGAGEGVLDRARQARRAALASGRSDMASTLAAHLIVELSVSGNALYRQGDYQRAIESYMEAISLCEEVDRADPIVRENLVRLRYNLARALHRADRWREAREQASMVLELDAGYVNAYALRAQAAMATFDWRSARDDWDQLLRITAGGAGPGGGAGAVAMQGGARLSLSAGQVDEEVVSGWRRRRDECVRNLTMDHYGTLDIPRLSNLESVRSAYREMQRRWHPDKHRSQPRDQQERADRRFKRIREAYEVLGDEASKRAYDAELVLSGATAGGAGAALSAPAGDGFETELPMPSVSSGLEGSDAAAQQRLSALVAALGGVRDSERWAEQRVPRANSMSSPGDIAQDAELDRVAEALRAASK